MSHFRVCWNAPELEQLERGSPQASAWLWAVPLRPETTAGGTSAASRDLGPRGGGWGWAWKLTVERRLRPEHDFHFLGAKLQRHYFLPTGRKKGLDLKSQPRWEAVSPD